MPEEADVATGGSDAGYVEFRRAGLQAKGEFRCADCGYGVTVHRALPTCPMCTGTVWERAAWTPLSRARPAF